MTQERDTPAPQVSGPDNTPGPENSASAPLRSEARPLPAPDRPRTIPILRLGPEVALAPDTDSEPRVMTDSHDAKPPVVASEVSPTVQEPGSDPQPEKAATAPDITAEQPDTGVMRLTDPLDDTATDADAGQGADADPQDAQAPADTTVAPDGPENEDTVASGGLIAIPEGHESAPAPKSTGTQAGAIQSDADMSHDAVIPETALDAGDTMLSRDTGEQGAQARASAKATPPPETGETPSPQATRPDPWAVLPDADMEDSRVAPDLAPDTVAETAPEPHASARSVQMPFFAPPARERPACEAALFGKLPSRGDFIARSMPRLLQRPFEDWLIPLVQQTRTDLGAQWNSVWRGAGPWRFWIGPDVLGGSWQRDLRKAAHEVNSAGGAVTGVLLPSADRHGRDFPLVLVLADGLARLMPPPVTTSPDRAWYDMCDDLLYAARAETDISAVEHALDRLPGPFLPDGAEAMDALLGQRALWAQGTETRPDGTSQIWHDIAQADHHLAASQRSYWWQAPKARSAQRVLSLAGLPDAGTFAFMLSQGHPGMSDPAP